MIKNLTCIECPKGCSLTIEVRDGKVITATGNQCNKGETYAVSEIENPVRILTSSVLAQGLSLRMIPVRTDKPIPRDKMFEAMKVIRKIRVESAVKTGDVIIKNFLDLDANLIATRDALTK